MNDIGRDVYTVADAESYVKSGNRDTNNVIIDKGTFNYFFSKRLLDLSITIPALILFLPLLLLVCIAVKIGSPGKAIFSQKRIGLAGREFRCLKFRTMRADAAEQLKKLLSTDPEAAAEWADTQKLKNDPRVTPIGKFLRKTSLDELPQLWNILKGEMSLVGPRPIIHEEISKYGSKFAAYTSIPPGVTGLWQISGRNDTSYDERVELDAEYANKRSILFDLKIIVLTIPTVLFSTGAY